MDALGIAGAVIHLVGHLVKAVRATVQREYQPVEILQQTRAKELLSLLNDPKIRISNDDRIDEIHARLHSNLLELVVLREKGVRPTLFSGEMPLQEMDSLSGKETFRLILARLHEDMTSSAPERIKNSIFGDSRAEIGRNRCPDPERGIGQHDLYQHKDWNELDEHGRWTSKKRLHVLLELILWCVSMASCWMMERLARPEANPSATVFVAAIWAYAAATGAIYFIHSDNRHIDLWIFGGGLCGLACGWVLGWTLEEIMFRLLPGFILFTLLLGSNCL